MSHNNLPPNENQQKAIYHIYGPMRVLAGPGTGKTEVLGQRIAHLLQSDAQISAENILCITYTDAGRIAMRERLTKICGPELAQAVSIHTFHSFCNFIIQNNPEYFKSEQVEPISEISKAILFKGLIDGLPSGHILKPTKNPYKYSKLISQVFDMIKKENIHTEEFIKAIDDDVEDLKERKDEFYYKRGKNKGTLKEDYYKEHNYYAITRAAVELFSDYKKLMQESGYYDFHDMILWVIEAFENDADFYYDLLERYQFILVDEYQDTNGAQNKLIELLTKPINEDELPNIFVVGDDDQSIYSFQGANRHNMEVLKNRYGNELSEINLDINYRSYQEILDFSEQFIKKNEDRIKTDFQGLTAARSVSNAQPELRIFQNMRQEMMWIALEVKKLLKEGIDPKEIAILFRNNDDVCSMAKYLNAIDIPFYSRTTDSLFDQPLIRKIISIFYYINFELEVPYRGDGYLYEILHYDFFGIQPRVIAEASYNCNKDKADSFRAYLLKWASTQNPSLFKDKPDDLLIEGTLKLEKLITIAASESVYVLLKEMIQILDIKKYMFAQANKTELIDQLSVFFRFLEEEAPHQDNLDLKGLINLFETMHHHDINVPHHRVFGDRNSVRISTIHKSKGLEYGYVFMPHVIAKDWEKNNTFGIKGARIPEVIQEKITHGEHLDKDKKKALAANEARRLLYVGYTRAKNRLMVSAAAYNDQDKEQEISTFLYESFPDLKENKTPYIVSLTPEEMIPFEPVDLYWNPEVQMIDDEKIDQFLSSFRLSVTAMNNYLECPLKFYYNNLIRIPSGISDSASYGSSVHKALELVYRDMQKGGKEIFPDKEIFIDYFKKDLYGRRRTMSKKGYQDFLDEGLKFLPKLYDEYILNSNKIVHLEWHPSGSLVYKGVPLTGFADKVEFNGKQCNIIDYKTGDFNGDYAKDQLKEADHKNGTLGGNYYRQAVFYKLMMDADKHNDWIVDSAEFLFVEPSKLTNKIESKKFYITPEDEELVGNLIVDVYQKIINKEFSVGCGKENCSWCNIVQAR